MFTPRYICTAFLCLIASACGTYVPDIQEPPAGKVTGQQLVDMIAQNITCEVQDAIDDIYNNTNRHRDHTFLDSWGAQITLTLQVDEKAIVSPSVNWLPLGPASAVFNLAAGGTLSADATRIDKLNSYFTVAELRKMGRCDTNLRSNGQLLLQNDLKLNEWLLDNVTEADNGTIDYTTDTATGPFKQNVLSHEVKFDITTSGNVSPALKLTRVSINPTAPFLSASRDRTNDLIVVLGPTETLKVKKKINGKTKYVEIARPQQPAVFSQLSSDIGNSVSNGIRPALLPMIP